MRQYFKAMREFFREFDDMTEHARTGRRPMRKAPAAGNPGKPGEAA